MRSTDSQTPSDIDGLPPGSAEGFASSDAAAYVADLSKTVRRQKVFLGAAIIAALAAGGGLAASTLIESPAQQAAETKAPKPSVLTASVMKKVLANTITTRGTVGAAGDLTVTPTPGGGSGSSPSGGNASLVVSKLYARSGDQIHAGQVLVEVSGRPIIALTGAVPAYRDLKPGMDGPDVAQLQAALSQLGHDCAPDSSGHFGPGTKNALTKLYAQLGYSVPTSGGPNGTGDQSALQSAADAVTTQQRAVNTDYSLLQKANQALVAARRAPSQSATPPPVNGSPSAPGVVPTTSAMPSANSLQAAQDAQKSAQTTYDNAVQDLEKARAKQDGLAATTGPMLPASEVVFVPSFPTRLATLNAFLGSTVNGPLLTLESGQLVVTSELQPGQNTLVKPGMKVRLDAEVLGDQTATATVTTIGTYTDGTAAGGQTGGQKNGQTAGDTSNSGQTTGGGVGGQQTQQLPGYPMTVTPDSPLPAAWTGQDVRVTIVNAATADAVLAVPLSAVSTGTDGQNSVTVVAADGTQRRVMVTAGASADGDVQVTPASGDALREGDQVVIGQAAQ